MSDKPPHFGTHEDVQEQHREALKNLGRAIDEIFNGEERPKKVGFAILMFDFAGPTSDRINYLSNAVRADMITAMKELISRFEGRHVEETATPPSKEVN